jgi:hypothetical protein
MKPTDQQQEQRAAEQRQQDKAQQQEQRAAEQRQQDKAQQQERRATEQRQQDKAQQQERRATEQRQQVQRQQQAKLQADRMWQQRISDQARQNKQAAMNNPRQSLADRQEVQREQQLAMQARSAEHAKKMAPEKAAENASNSKPSAMYEAYRENGLVRGAEHTRNLGQNGQEAIECRELEHQARQDRLMAMAKKRFSAVPCKGNGRNCYAPPKNIRFVTSSYSALLKLIADLVLTIKRKTTAKEPLSLSAWSNTERPQIKR